MSANFSAHSIMLSAIRSGQCTRVTLARGQPTRFPEFSLVTERIADQAIGIPGSMGKS
jgi:hypothetical protein